MFYFSQSIEKKQEKFEDIIFVARNEEETIEKDNEENEEELEEENEEENEEREEESDNNFEGEEKNNEEIEIEEEVRKTRMENPPEKIENNELFKKKKENFEKEIDSINEIIPGNFFFLNIIIKVKILKKISDYFLSELKKKINQEKNLKKYLKERICLHNVDTKVSFSYMDLLKTIDFFKNSKEEIKKNFLKHNGQQLSRIVGLFFIDPMISLSLSMALSSSDLTVCFLDPIVPESRLKRQIDFSRLSVIFTVKSLLPKLGKIILF